jgi:transcriptional regulator with XRE-family HTH domain
MIGLEYVLMISGTQHTKLANQLNMSRQNVNLWIKGKQLVSKKHLDVLSEMFKVPQLYFNKEITKEDKLFLLNCEINRINSEDNV